MRSGRHLPLRFGSRRPTGRTVCQRLFSDVWSALLSEQGKRVGITSEPVYGPRLPITGVLPGRPLGRGLPGACAPAVHPRSRQGLPPGCCSPFPRRTLRLGVRRSVEVARVLDLQGLMMAMSPTHQTQVSGQEFRNFCFWLWVDTVSDGTGNQDIHWFVFADVLCFGRWR